MHYLYILYSPLFDRYYIGESVNIQERLSQHNSHHYTHASTSFTSDWIIAIHYSLQNRKEALIIEKYLKSLKSKKFLRALHQDIEAQTKFKESIEKKFNIIL